MQQLSSGASRVILLRRVWNDYRTLRPLKESSLDRYNKLFHLYLHDWADRSIASITKDECYLRHQLITKTRGAAVANQALRLLRGLYNFAQTRYEDSQGNPVFRVNPVSRLSELRCWNKERPKRRYIQPIQMRAWYTGMSALKNSAVRDALLLIMHTGLRKGEACGLRWEDVDMDRGIFTVRDTKNGSDHTLPMAEYVYNLFRRRQRLAKADDVFVFSGTKQQKLCINGQYHVVIEQCGIEFSPHDLRRTFLTIAESLDFQYELIRALANHKSSSVTERYIIRSPERLRRPMQAISDCILALSGIKAEEPTFLPYNLPKVN